MCKVKFNTPTALSNESSVFGRSIFLFEWRECCGLGVLKDKWCPGADYSPCSPLTGQRRCTPLFKAVAQLCRTNCLFSDVRILSFLKGVDSFGVGVMKINGAPETIRTSDLPLRRRLLYPAELPGHEHIAVSHCRRFHLSFEC